MYPLLVLLVAVATACGASPPPQAAEATPALPVAEDIVGAGAAVRAGLGSVWVTVSTPGEAVDPTSSELRTSPPTPRKTYARGTITRAAVAR
jgi:hypothetical protein